MFYICPVRFLYCFCRAEQVRESKDEATRLREEVEGLKAKAESIATCVPKA